MIRNVFFLTVAVGTIALAGLSAFGQAYVGSEKLSFTALSGAPTLDGSDADTVWAGAQWIQASDGWNATAPADEADMSARFKAGYFDDRIYMFVDVTDQEDDNTNSAFWAKDCVELFFDIDRVGGALGDAAAQQAAWEGAGGPVQLRFHYAGGQIEISDAAYSSSTIDYATDNATAGRTYYEIMLAPPAATLPLADRNSFGFVMHLVDADAGEYNCSIGWWGGPQQAAGVYNAPPDTGGTMPYANADVYSEAGFVTSLVGGPLISDADLVAYYSFDNIGSVVADGSGNGYDGTVNGTITAVAGGKRGGAGQFASTAFLDMDGPNIAASDIPTSGFTLAAWCNVEDTGSQHAVWNARSADGTFLIHPEIRPSDYRLTLRGDSSTTIGSINAGTPVFGEWLHYVATYDQASGGMVLYINGQVVGSVAVGALENAVDMAGDWDNGARVGYNVDDNRPFTGLMDEFYLFKRALSPAEVEVLYALEEPTPPSGNEVVFRFDCGTEGFVPQNNVTVDHILGWMVVKPTGGDPYAQASVSIAGSTLTEFGALIEVQNAPDANPINAAMFWFGNGGHGRAPFTLNEGPNEVRFNVPATKESGAANWDDSVNAVRFDLPDNTAEQPFIDAGTAFLFDAVAFSDSATFVPDPWTLDNDCDNDGLSNSFEEAFGTDPLNPDSDGDGVDDGTELEHGSDPSDPNSTVEVPAMGHGALALLALLLALATVLAIGRRFRHQS